ncbi:MAG: DUF1592 domain-containing protein, partial [Planctomycetota bacterium]
SVYVANVIDRFAERAFRGRRPSEKYMCQLSGIYRELRDDGASINDALIEPLAILLASPQFLYMINDGGQTTKDPAKSHSLVEPLSADKPDSTTGQRLTQLELSHRLAFMLWSEPADEALVCLANAGKLASPAILRNQVDRMLDDPRSQRFIRDFTHQWLQMDRLGMFQFNGAHFPTFDNSVREYGRQEVVETVSLILHNELPLSKLLKSDFVVVNDLLAEYYGIPEIQGHHFRAVPLGRDSVRGGLLGTVAVCAMGSDGLRTSPVERGAWVMRHLLHDPPAPAPPNVPQLNRLDDGVVSARSIQRLHQEQPQCAQCHRKIDPIGFGLENFSADGLWREKETVRYGKRNTLVKQFDIDPSGQLPSGEAFSSYQQLRSLVESKSAQFARGFIESLIAYGLGRPYGFSDDALADAISKETATDGFKIKPILHALVQSNAFQSR